MLHVWDWVQSAPHIVGLVLCTKLLQLLVSRPLQVCIYFKLAIGEPVVVQALGRGLHAQRSLSHTCHQQGVARGLALGDYKCRLRCRRFGRTWVSISAACITACSTGLSFLFCKHRSYVMHKQWDQVTVV